MADNDQHFVKQVAQLHDLVQDLRTSLVSALTDLADLHGSDRDWRQEIAILRCDWEKKLAAVEQIVARIDERETETARSVLLLTQDHNELKANFDRLSTQVQLMSLRSANISNESLLDCVAKSIANDSLLKVSATQHLNSDCCSTDTENNAGVGRRINRRANCGDSPEAGYVSDCSNDTVSDNGGRSLAVASGWNNVTSLEIDYKTDSTLNDSLDLLLCNRFITQNQSQAIRYEVCLDFLRTERHYCACLWSLIEHVYEPLKLCPAASQKDLGLLFPPQLFALYQLHCTLLHALQLRLDTYEPESTLVAPVFSRVTAPDSQATQIYVNYVNSFHKMTPIVKQLFRAESPELLSILSRPMPLYYSKKAKPLNELLLNSMLVYPVQRIPQYTLYLQRLLKHTAVDHPDYKSLSSELENARRLGQRLNSSVLAERQGSLKSADSPPPIKPRRKKHGTLPPSAKSNTMEAGRGSTHFVKRRSIIRRHSNCSSSAAAKITRSSSQARVLKNDDESSVLVSMECLLPTDNNDPKVQPESGCLQSAVSEPSIATLARQVQLDESANSSNLNSSRSEGDVSLADWSNASAEPTYRKTRKRKRHLHSFRSTVLAFFSRKKNQHRFSKKCNYGTSTLP